MSNTGSDIASGVLLVVYRFGHKTLVLKYEPFLKVKLNAFLQKVGLRNRNEEKYDFKYECVSVQHLHKVIYTTFFKLLINIISL